MNTIHCHAVKRSTRSQRRKTTSQWNRNSLNRWTEAGTLRAGTEPLRNHDVSDRCVCNSFISFCFSSVSPCASASLTCALGEFRAEQQSAETQDRHCGRWHFSLWTNTEQTGDQHQLCSTARLHRRHSLSSFNIRMSCDWTVLPASPVVLRFLIVSWGLPTSLCVTCGGKMEDSAPATD